MKYDSTDKLAFYAIMAFTVLTGVVCYFLFAAATPKAGVVDSIYRLELPPQTAASATENKTAAVPSGPSVALSIPSGASTQGNPAYDPATLTIKKGDIVAVTNNDNAPHTVTSDKGKLFDSGLIMPGKTIKVNTASLAPGTYPFHCTVHTFMAGTLTVKG